MVGRGFKVIIARSGHCGSRKSVIIVPHGTS